MPVRKQPPPRNDGTAAIDALFSETPGWPGAMGAAQVAVGVAQSIYDLRERHGLTQKGLAARVGTTQSVIARLEDADYEGHSLRMLARVAAAVGEHVTIAFSGETERTVA
jgi:DNA-binding XRE family transcriptional regulator